MQYPLQTSSGCIGLALLESKLSLHLTYRCGSYIGTLSWIYDNKDIIQFCLMLSITELGSVNCHGVALERFVIFIGCAYK